MRDWLRQCREEKGLTQESVANKAAISRGYYARIECGDYKIPAKTAKAIAAVLGIDWTRFYRD